MGATAQSAETMAANVQNDLRSASTVSPATLNLLRALLGFDFVEVKKATEATKKAVLNSQKSRKLATTAEPRARSVKPKATSQFAIYETSDASVPALAVEKRRKLATESFNASLKHLSDAAKGQRHDRSGQASVCKKEPKSSPTKQITALQNRSPNRQKKGAETVKVPSSTASSRSKEANHIGAVADCARISLRCLENLEVADKSAAKDNLQLENASLIFLEKLSSLGLRDRAVLEASHLHTRLQGSSTSCNKAPAATSGPSVRVEDQCRQLWENIHLARLPTNAETFKLAVSYQSQVLQVGALLGPSFISQNLVDRLRPDEIRSPCRVILGGLEAGFITAEKAGQRLYNLSQSLSRLCTVAMEACAVKHCSPETLFNLQSLVLDIRCRSWKPLQHSPDTNREIWEVFNRTIGKYCAAVKDQQSLDFKVLLCAAKQLQSVLQSEGFDSRLSSGVANNLTELAQTSGNHTDALALLKALEESTPGLQGLARVTHYCKIASIRLNSGQSDLQSTLDASDQALALLQKPLKGSAAELTDLLLHCARLRKAALTAVADVEKLIATSELTELHLRLQTCATRLVFAILHFILRYLDTQRSTCTNKKDVPLAPTLPPAVISSAERCIDAVLTSARSMSANSILLRDETEVALQDCVSLAQVLDATAVHSDVEQSTSCGMCMRVSHLFWSAYLEGKRSGLSPKALCTYLEKSVAVMTQRSLVEQRKASLATKLERLAGFHLDMANNVEARELLQDAVKLHITSGALTQAVEISLEKPKQSAWNDPTTESYALSGCLRSFVRCSGTRRSVSPFVEFFYDDSRLPNIHRAVCLEYQLLQAMEMRTEVGQDHLQKTATEILHLYCGSSYRFCRARFLRDLLNHNSRNGEIFPPDFLSQLLGHNLADDASNDDSNVFLACYGPLLQATVSIQREYLQVPPDARRLEESVEAINACLAVCHNKTDLAAVCDDLAVVLNQLQAMADYAGMLYLPLLQSKILETLLKTVQLCKYEKSDALSSCLARLGDLQTRMGRSMDAGRTFAAAEEALTDSPSANVHLVWSLSYAGYLLDLTHLQKCSKVLESAKEEFEVNRPEQGQSELSKSQSSQLHVLGYASFLASKLALKNGDLANAVLLARRCIKLTTAVWTTLEKQFIVHPPSEAALNEMSLASTSIEVSVISMSVDKAACRSTIKGAAFWSYVDLHFQALLYVSSLAAHSGIYQDAVHYASQAQKLAVSINSGTRTTLARAALMVLHGKGGQHQLTRKLLSTCPLDDLRLLSNVEIARYFLDEATAFLTLKEYKSAQASLAKVRGLVQTLKLSAQPGNAAEDTTEGELEKSMGKLTVRPRTVRQTARKTPSNSKSGPVARSKRVPKAVAVPSSTQTHYSSNSPSTQMLEDAILVLETELELQGYASHTSDVIQKPVHSSTESSAEKDVVLASALLSQAFNLFASDAVHCVLAETAIALPSRYRSRRSSSRSAIPPGTSPVAPKGGRLQAKHKMNSPDIDQPQALLRAAYDMLASSTASRRNEVASSILHTSQKLLARLTLLSSAVEVSIEHSSTRVIQQSLEPKDIMMRRDRMGIEAERATNVQSSLQEWPSVVGFDNTSIDQEELPALPPSWSVVSIELNDDRSEFFVSRISHGSTPFLLRIPLCRSSAEDEEVAGFTFQQAKQELFEIIAAANSSAHDPRAQAEKQIRKKWWSERESLDQQLAVLLQNIEEIWFGGFRGILTQTQMTDINLVSRFAESLSQSLDSHLPSRQKSSNVSRSKIQLHAHVLCLFLTLGHPDHRELDESITDLIYFVVDVLQFDGECNAYDEIDFDAILVDVLDALRSYHEAASPDVERQHTILILDKELHAFPWESLPCLFGRSVSRLPSMSCVQSRLSKIHAQNSSAQAYTISSQSGSYILNPSSDLPTTQNTFTGPFSTQLSHFTSIIGRKPSESEFESYLQKNDLLLYFGHGSGAQYIRGRRIKSLPPDQQCAVTFLMGCSSTKMAECGVYESYGVPVNYMQAGSMAVVGTLWDVTDRDIDRFATEAFVEWGLLDETEEGVEQRGAKCKGRGKAGAKKMKARSKEERKGKVTLDEAVSSARGACLLRYLNGAAVVMYGVPVVLE